MEIIPNGTKVLIFKYIRERNKQDEENYLKGTVQTSRISDDLSYHGSPWYEQIYEVLGEDGNIYVGCYGTGIIGNSYFRTIDDHINFLKNIISNNEQEILKIKEKNDRYFRQIKELEEHSKKRSQSSSVLTKKLIPLKKYTKI